MRLEGEIEGGWEREGKGGREGGREKLSRLQEKEN